MNPDPIVVIGVGPQGSELSPDALDLILRAQLLAGGKRHLGYFPRFQGEKLEIDADLPRVIRRLKEAQGHLRCVVLASGDPLFYGIGKTLLESLPRELLVFLPHVSSVQLAFARLKESWDDACIVSLHGRPIDLLRPALAQGQSKIAIFTDGRNDPPAIGSYLLENGCADQYRFWVGENLGGTEERCSFWPLADLANVEFAPLNIVLLLKENSWRAGSVSDRSVSDRSVGLPVEVFQHRDGQITRWEVRLLSIGSLELRPGDVLWDIGAGSGSIGIEAARLVPGLSVWAVEKDTDACRHIRENAARLGAVNVNVVAGEAPKAFEDLPAPDAVFVGGNGGKLAEILAAIMARIKPHGRVVLNCVTLDSLNLAWSWCKDRQLTPEVTSVQIARSRRLGSQTGRELTCLEPEKPIFIVRFRFCERAEQQRQHEDC